MTYFDHLAAETSAQSITRVLEQVNVPETTIERLDTFEDITIDAFLYILVGKRIPLLSDYLATVLLQKPDVRQDIKDKLGQLGIKALAGVPVVMLKEFDSETVEASLPGIIPMLMHHLLEVVSDKLEGQQLSQLFNIPDDFAAKFALFAYELLGDRPFESVEADALAFLDNLNIREIDISRLDPSILALLDSKKIQQFANAIDAPQSQITQIETVNANPVKWMLLLNLLAIEIAAHHIHHSYIWEHSELVNREQRSPMFDFSLEALGARYFAATITEYPGYGDMELEQAIETRADSILTSYTISAVISALAVADDTIQQKISAEQTAIENLILLASTLIGLANDCGATLLRMSPREIRAEINKLRILTPTPRPSLSKNPIADLHEQAKDGELDEQYLALFPLIKDISKGERNLALDCKVDDTLQGWDTVTENVILLAQNFVKTEQAFKQQSKSLNFKPVGKLMHNFIQYNYQIYALGADYDHRKPIIEQLDIMK